MAHKAVVVGCHLLKLLKNEFGDQTREPTESELEIVDLAFNFIRKLCDDGDEEVEFEGNDESEGIQESEDFEEFDDSPSLTTGATSISPQSHPNIVSTKSTSETGETTTTSVSTKKFFLPENMDDWRPKPFISGRQVSLETMERIIKCYRTGKGGKGTRWKTVCHNWCWMRGRRSAIAKFETYLKNGGRRQDVLKEISEGLYNFIKQEQSNQRDVFRRDLQRVASEINNNRIKFCLSDSWQREFRKRYGLKLGCKTYELMNPPEAMATAATTSCSRMQQQDGLSSATSGSIADEEPFELSRIQKDQAGSS